MRALKRLALTATALLFVLVVIAGGLEWRVRENAPDETATRVATASSENDIARGAYVARLGHCAGCHTARGGAPFAGGRIIETPFGAVTSANLTSDAATGLGRWSAVDFEHALREGRTPGGRRVVPVCPFPNFSHASSDDVRALHAYLRSLPPTVREGEVQRLRWPFGTQLALATWRALYFRPQPFAPDPSRSAAWHRGRELVHGLGHCTACHGARNAFGAERGDLARGGAIPGRGWYAPSLALAGEAGVSHWAQADVVALLKHGKTARASTIGPMAEVVFGSTQHWRDDDLDAAATYLRSLGPAALPEASPPLHREAPRAAREAPGARLYEQHCADCHGKQGEGVAGRWPALAGNRVVTHALPNNVVKIIVHGGFTPATAGNPRPFGMPPFGITLDDEAIAALATHLRTSWGHDAGAVSALDVMKLR